ncbi:lipopolysaccharide biosynthesis protein [Candidatus Vecturithrix granuli]|uniref:Lipopolysaccharide biosynthesis protein n=1 Tax=Vecturithrix granuli TaxID=1499967 RepID=A0A081C5E1_VECG1|nr:lipopolysaccharide biosynthesis protein [Candidatus Vecturithrix granuli]
MKQKEIHLFDYFLVLRRRRWILFSTFILVVVSATIGAYRKPDPEPLFQATATLVVKPDRPALVNIRGAQPFYQEYFDEGVDQRTQLEILKSRVILERLVNELGFLQPESSAKDEERILAEVRQAINVYQMPGTYLVNIVAQQKTPDMAIKLANTMAEVYIEYNLQTKLSSARKTLVWLNEQIVDLRGKVQDAYTALSDYQSKNDILSLEMAPEVQAAKLAELTNLYDRAQQERIEAETRLTELRKIQQQGLNFGTDIAGTLEDPVIGNLRAELSSAEIERSSLLQSYKDKHPTIKQVDLKIETLRQNLAKEIGTLFKKLETNVSVLKAREASLANSLNAFKREAMEINEKRVEYSKLKSEVTSTEELYNLLFRQLKETSITGDLVEKNTMRILESARAALNITAPMRREQIVVFGVIIGFVLGIGFAFLFEYFDKTVKTPEDVEYFLELPVLGTIPKIDKADKKLYGKSSSSLSSKKKYYALEGGK